MHPKSDIMDYPSALERIGGDASFLKELIDLYKEDFMEHYRSLEQALSLEDFKSIQEIGHSIKGASANLSFDQLTEQAFEVENAGRAENLGQAQSSSQALKQQFDRLLAYLEALSL